jgi:PAS domain S-box-containing protein
VTDSQPQGPDRGPDVPLPSDLADLLLEGCQVLDTEWRYRFVNEAAARQGRIPSRELLGRRIQDVYPGIEETPVFDVLRRVMTTREPAAHEAQFTHPDGTLEWFDLRVLPVPLGVMILSVDISARRRAEAEYQAWIDQARLATAIHQAAEMVLVTDEHGRISYVNPAFERITGYTSAEAVGKNPRLLKSGNQDENYYRELWQTLESEGLWRGRMVNRRKDGTTYTQDSTISKVRDAAGRHVGYVAVTRDVSSELELEAQLAHAQRMETIGRLTGGIAHDFNNLLAVILSSAEFVLQELPADDARRADVAEIQAAGQRAAALTRQLLAFGRRQAVQPVVVDLREVVRRIEPMFRRLLPPDIVLSVQSTDDGCAVRADASHIDQLVMNLVINARDAMPSGGRLNVEVSTAALDETSFEGRSAARPGRYVKLVISDTGVGMDEVTRARAFEPFFTTKGVGKGTGLGLAMVYGIVNQCGGHIWLYSEPGVGTTFKIYFPCVTDAEATVDGPTTGDGGAAGELLLVVEDEPAVLAVTRRILVESGYRVLAAASVAEALRTFERFGDEIALVLTDVVMPEGGGLALMTTLQERRPDLPVVLMSGYADDAVVQRGLQPGNFRLLGKPFSAAELQHRVGEALAHRRHIRGQGN